MISFLKYNITPGELLFADDFPTGPLDDRWEISGGEWNAEDGILTGCFRGNGGGLIVTLSDPDPITAPDCARVGLGTYCSQIRVRKFRLYRPNVEQVEREYTPNF